MIIRQEIIDIISEELSIDDDDVEIVAETKLVDDLGMDSLDAVTIAMALEERFELEALDDYLENVKTVGELQEVVDKLIAKKKR